MQNKYLPSKKFKKRAIIILGIAVIVFLAIKGTPIIREKISERNEIKNLLVKDLVVQDTNENGIQDWEETLWGLDPAGDGEKNKQIILAKKGSLEGSSTVNGDTEIVTDNDKLAREFFALVVSLQQSGNLSEEAIKNISESIGKEIVTEAIPDHYTRDAVKIQNTTPLTIRSYYSALQKLSKKYEDSDIGNEMTFIGQAVSRGDEQALRVAGLVADSYQAFGEELIKIPVPTSLATTHIALANNYYKTGAAIKSMSDMFENPLSGMIAVIQYKRHNDELIAGLESLQTFFERNGILKNT